MFPIHSTCIHCIVYILCILFLELLIMITVECA